MSLVSISKNELISKINELTDRKEKLDILELSKEFKLDNDSEFVTKFFMNLEDDVQIFIDNYVIKTFGYTSENIRDHKRNIINNLNKTFSEMKGIEWFEYSKAEFIKFYDSLPETEKKLFTNPHISKNGSGNNIVYYTMSADIYKRLLMSANSKESKKVQSYFLNLEKLMKLYRRYIAAYDNKKLMGNQEAISYF